MALKAQRTCVGCGRKADKAALVRFERRVGDVALDARGRGQGRGAYVCPERQCLDAARKKRALERALRTKIDGACWSRLEQEFDMLCASHSDAQ